MSLIKRSSESKKSVNYLSYQGFVCNFRDHWIAVRRIGNSWWNLDSLKKRPEKLSQTYLEAYLEQLVVSKYSIFVVEGKFPNELEEKDGPNWTLIHDKEDEDKELLEAIQLSMMGGDQHIVISDDDEDDEDEELRIALELSKSEK